MARLLAFFREAAVAESFAQGIAPSVTSLFLCDGSAREASHPGLRPQHNFQGIVAIDPATPGDELTVALAKAQPYAAYFVERTVLKRTPLPRKPGDGFTRQDGIHVVSLVARNPALDADGFFRHWREIHAPIALAEHVGMSDYAQERIIETWRESPAFDGVARLRFASTEALRNGLYRSREGARLLYEDTKRFVNSTRLELAFMSEYLPG